MKIIRKILIFGTGYFFGYNKMSLKIPKIETDNKMVSVKTERNGNFKEFQVFGNSIIKKETNNKYLFIGSVRIEVI